MWDWSIMRCFSCWPPRIRLAWHPNDLCDLHTLLLLCSLKQLLGVQQQHVGVNHFTTYIVLTSFFRCPLQQVQTCVWDVSSPFRIVLVNASKVNAEETAKVSTKSTATKHSFRSLLIRRYMRNIDSCIFSMLGNAKMLSAECFMYYADRNQEVVLLFNLHYKASWMKNAHK